MAPENKQSKIPEIIVMSEHEAISYAQKATVPSAIISITTLTADDIRFASNENIRYIFHMHFNDLETDYARHGYVYKAPVAENMKGLKKAVDRIFKMDVEKIIVHCAAGISRSAAVAQAISDYKNLGYNLWANHRYCPNRLVYRLCMDEFGIGKNKEYYEAFFKEVDEEREKTDPWKSICL